MAVTEDTVRQLVQAALSGDQRLTQMENFLATGTQRFNEEAEQNRNAMEQVYYLIVEYLELLVLAKRL